MVEANRTSLQAANLELEDVLGKHFADTYWWSYAEAAQAQLRTAIANALTGEVVRYDATVRLGENRFIVIDFMLAPILTTTGEVTYLIPSGVDVTERRRTETALRQSEERLRLATNAGGIGIFDHDLVNDQIEYSDIYRKIADFAADSSPTRAEWLARVHPDDQAMIEEHLQRAKAFGESYQYEYRIVHRDGSTHWLAVSALVITDENGRGIRLTGAIRDITARKTAEAALRRSEAQFRAVQQATPDGFMIFESVRDATGAINDFRWLYINPAAEQLVGRTREELVGKLLLEEMPGNRTEGIFDAYVQVVQSGEVWQREFLYQHEEMDDWFRSTAAKTGDGFAVAFSNITEQKAMEAALAESEQRFRSTFEQAAVGMAHTDASGRYLQVNERLCEILGYTRAELLQKRFIDLIHPEERARSAMLNEQLLSGQLSSYTVEKRYIRGDGTPIWVHVTASSVFAEADEVSYRLAVVEDISARKAAEAALQELNATLEERVHERTIELERSNRELDQFAYVASHDLRAPLRAIDHLSNWIVEDAGATLPPSSQQHLDTLRGRVHRMEQLLEDLLLYSRVGRQPTRVELVNSSKLIAELIDLLNVPAAFTINVDTAMPTFETYRVPLELVLRNLISNAIKHHDREDGHVYVSAQTKGNWVEFTVEDDGPGIDSAFHERIFQIFQTLQPRDEVEGSGMGLAVVKKAVESMGGIIRVESTEGAGATFRFTWPQVSREDQ
ncbi:MAG: PAS domain S-box protein [Caldilineaceae bacterium]